MGTMRCWVWGFGLQGLGIDYMRAVTGIHSSMLTTVKLGDLRGSQNDCSRILRFLSAPHFEKPQFR